MVHIILEIVNKYIILKNFRPSGVTLESLLGLC